MQIDLKTVNIEAKRNAFDHLVARFGDKPASRYQEATYDVQPDTNLQYRPTWDPDRELYDARRTCIEMKDWYALKDPRQYYYGTYTLARARQQESAEGNFQFFESRELASSIDASIKDEMLSLLVPLRHAAWGANMNNMAIAAEGYGTAVTQACTYHAMDNLGIAQYLTRIGLIVEGADYIDYAKAQWINDERWQGLRRYVEEMLVIDDWFQLFIAQNLILDGLLYSSVYQQAVDQYYASRGASAIAMTTSFMGDWFKETSRWVDAVVKVAAAESDHNKSTIEQWVNQYRTSASEALVSILKPVSESAELDFLEDALDGLGKRLKKIGLGG